ncbi:MAG: peptidoglycan-binding domain-containing protein, partial [Rhodovibrionaceae bacterium]
RSGRQDAGADYRAQVKDVQQALNQRGFNAGPADGALGPKTRTAIREYESSEQLPVTGEMSGALLQSLSLATQQPAPVSGEDPTAADVEEELSRLGYAVGPVDGVLDNQAQAAIRYYQRTYGLGVTGDASENLLDHLREQRDENNGETLSKLVLDVEQELVRHGYRTGTVDGTVDVDTRGAILSFQSRSGAEADGKVSAKLLRSLQDTPVAGGSGSDDDSLLTAAEVQEVETLLQQLGYRVGPVDGVQDTMTNAAVRNYQTNAGLNATGRIDQPLLRSLRMDSAAATEVTPGRVISDVLRYLNQR